MIWWLTSQCFLTSDPQSTKMLSNSQVKQETMKICARAIFELLVVLLCLNVSTNHVESLWDYVYCFATVALLSVKAVWREQTKVFFRIFATVYLLLNIIVNSIDFIVYKQILGFYNDELFNRMFSFKVFQGALCMVTAFVFSEALRPQSKVVGDQPGVLAIVYNLSFPSNIALFVTFLFELTFYEEEQRNSIFKTQLAKVFFTSTIYFLLGVVFSHWLQQLSEHAAKTEQDEKDFASRASQVIKEIEAIAEISEISEKEKQRFIKQKLRNRRPQVEVLADQIKAFNPAFCDILGYFDFICAKFDLFVVQECRHLAHSFTNPYVVAMRDIQTRAAVSFFLLVHVPLSRINPGFTIVTAMLPLMLNLRTKYWIYEMSNSLVVKVFKGDKEAVNYVQKSKDLVYESNQVGIE